MRVRDENMGKVTGFLEIDRQVAKYQPASDRIRHFREFTIPMSDPEVQKQAFFWLGQTHDPRALAFFEQVLTK